MTPDALVTRVLMFAAIAPGVLLASAGVVWTAAPGVALWPADRVNLSEAAATRNTGEVVRLLRLGANPHEAVPVRAGLLDGSRPVDATPLEAAIRVRRGDVIWTLRQYAPPPPPATLAALRCQAADDAAVLAALDEDAPGEIPPCSSGR
jgi:hypothetical protein